MDDDITIKKIRYIILDDLSTSNVMGISKWSPFLSHEKVLLPEAIIHGVMVFKNSTYAET